MTGHICLKVRWKSHLTLFQCFFNYLTTWTCYIDAVLMLKSKKLIVQFYIITSLRMNMQSTIHSDYMRRSTIFSHTGSFISIISFRWSWKAIYDGTNDIEWCYRFYQVPRTKILVVSFKFYCNPLFTVSIKSSTTLFLDKNPRIHSIDWHIIPWCDHSWSPSVPWG